MPGEKNTPSPQTAESRLGMRGPKLPCGWAMVARTEYTGPWTAHATGMLNPEGRGSELQLKHLGREAWAKIFVHADAAPLRRGLLAAKMCGGFARIASAFEGEIKLDVVFGIEITPLGVKTRNIARRHDQLSPMI